MYQLGKFVNPIDIIYSLNSTLFRVRVYYMFHMWVKYQTLMVLSYLTLYFSTYDQVTPSQGGGSHWGLKDMVTYLCDNILYIH